MSFYEYALFVMKQYKAAEDRDDSAECLRLLQLLKTTTEEVIMKYAKPE